MLSRLLLVILFLQGCSFLDSKICEKKIIKKAEVFSRNVEFKKVLDTVPFSDYCLNVERKEILHNVEFNSNFLSGSEKEIYYTYLIYAVFYKNSDDLMLLLDYMYDNNINIKYYFDKVYENKKILKDLGYNKRDKEVLNLVKISINNIDKSLRVKNKF